MLSQTKNSSRWGGTVLGIYFPTAVYRSNCNGLEGPFRAHNQQLGRRNYIKKSRRSSSNAQSIWGLYSNRNSIRAKSE